MVSPEHESIIRECFDNQYWDPIALFPEKFNGHETGNEFVEIVRSITFEEFRTNFLAAIDKREILWEEFEF